LQPGIPPFQQRLRIVANAPQEYTVRVQSTDYFLPSDGRVEFKVGGMSGCSVYLFGRIPIRRAPNPTKEKIISIMNGTARLQMLSLHDLATLPRDGEGVPQIAISNVPPQRRPARPN
jgi:hypothetical protein